MKLKENLYLLNNYGLAAIAIDSLADHNAMRYRQLPAISRLVDIGALIGRITRDVTRQMERMGFLFGQVNYFLRTMLSELVEKMLIIRLLAEQEEVVVELWGGVAGKALFNGIFSGRDELFAGAMVSAGTGNVPEGLACDRHCDEAIVRIAHLKAILGDTPGMLNGK